MRKDKLKEDLYALYEFNSIPDLLEGIACICEEVGKRQGPNWWEDEYKEDAIAIRALIEERYP